MRTGTNDMGRDWLLAVISGFEDYGDPDGHTGQLVGDNLTIHLDIQGMRQMTMTNTSNPTWNRPWILGHPLVFFWIG